MLLKGLKKNIKCCKNQQNETKIISKMNIINTII